MSWLCLVALCISRKLQDLRDCADTHVAARSSLREGLAPLLAVANDSGGAPVMHDGVPSRPPSPQTSGLPSMAAVGAHRPAPQQQAVKNERRHILVFNQIQIQRAPTTYFDLESWPCLALEWLYSYQEIALDWLLCFFQTDLALCRCCIGVGMLCHPGKPAARSGSKRGAVCARCLRCLARRLHGLHLPVSRPCAR